MRGAISARMGKLVGELSIGALGESVPSQRGPQQVATEVLELLTGSGVRTSKWNKIEHRLFSFISQNWRGKPLISHEVIVKLIGAATITTGLRVRSRLDTRSYPAGVKVSREAIDAVVLRPASFHGDWNYTIIPNSPAKKR
jgi:Rhodopirellula transposase DDE domain